MKVILLGKVVDMDPENLDGYFTFNEAQEVAKKSGKRLMTKEELEDLCECENWWDEGRKGRVFKVQTPDDGYEEVFFPAAGYRSSSDGSLYNVDAYGNYWSSSPKGTYGHYLFFYPTGVNPANYTPRQYGYSVRLVKE